MSNGPLSGNLPSASPFPLLSHDINNSAIIDINLLGLLHQSLVIDHNDVRTMVLDTLYVLMTRPIVPVQDGPLIAMRRDAFSEESLAGYNQVLDQIFSSMLTRTGSHLEVDRDNYGVGKKFVMVLPSPYKATHRRTRKWGKLRVVYLCTCDCGIDSVTLCACTYVIELFVLVVAV